MTNKALTSIEQKQVVFYDDEITAVRLENGRIFIPYARFVNFLVWFGLVKPTPAYLARSSTQR